MTYPDPIDQYKAERERRRDYAIARATERERVTRRLTAGRCTGCGKPASRVGPYLICRNLRCNVLTVRER